MRIKSESLAVSSFSLRQRIGPIRLVLRDSEGALSVSGRPYPREISLSEFAEGVGDRMGISLIEICQIQIEDPGTLSDIGETLEESGVRVLNMPLDIGDLGVADDSLRRADVNEHIAWFDRAQALGSSFVRVNPGSRKVHGRSDIGPLLKSLDELSDAASERGLRLLVENHGGDSSRPEYLLNIVREIGSSRIGILLDLGNFAPVLERLEAARLTGADPARLTDPAELHGWIAELAPHADLLHAKSYGHDADDQPVVFDPEAALRVALGSGFNGPITAEYEGEAGDPWSGTERLVTSVRTVTQAISRDAA